VIYVDWFRGSIRSVDIESTLPDALTPRNEFVVAPIYIVRSMAIRAKRWHRFDVDNVTSIFSPRPRPSLLDRGLFFAARKLFYTELVVHIYV
jgi:hypothetical protein